MIATVNLLKLACEDFLSDEKPASQTISTEFVTLKKTLQQSPTLALPNPDKPFVQAVDERDHCMTSVLLQSHGDKYRPVAYFSAKLDPVAAGLPRCLRAVAACEKAVLASRDIVGSSDLTLLVPHAVSLILTEQKNSHLSAARWLRYHTVLLDMPNITVKRCSTLNPAFFRFRMTGKNTTVWLNFKSSVPHDLTSLTNLFLTLT